MWLSSSKIMLFLMSGRPLFLLLLSLITNTWHSTLLSNPLSPGTLLTESALKRTIKPSSNPSTSHSKTSPKPPPSPKSYAPSTNKISTTNPLSNSSTTTHLKSPLIKKPDTCSPNQIDTVSPSSSRLLLNSTKWPKANSQTQISTRKKSKSSSLSLSAGSILSSFSTATPLLSNKSCPASSNSTNSSTARFLSMNSSSNSPRSKTVSGKSSSCGSTTSTIHSSLRKSTSSPLTGRSKLTRKSLQTSTPNWEPCCKNKNSRSTSNWSRRWSSTVSRTDQSSR